MQLIDFLKVLARLLPWIVALMLARPLTFRPAPGSKVSKHLSSQWNVRLDEMAIVLDGKVWWTGFSMDTGLSQHIAVTDTYFALQDGGPLALDREFGAIAQNLEVSLGNARGHQEWGSVTGTSELEGTVVQFRRAEGAWVPRFAPLDRHLDEAWLDGLTEDMDLRALLPKELASVGDAWEIDLDSLPDILSPGGYFAWTLDSEGTVLLLGDALDPVLMGELRHVLGAMLEGHATVAYVGEEDGISELALVIDITGAKDVNDLSKLAAQLVEESPEWATLEVRRLDLDFALEAAGTARWDSRRGHIFDFELTGKIKSAMDLEVVLDAGSEFVIEVRTAASGDFEQTVETR